jgi:murein DD-endopeptidase MepM/ murein hydrolase activator NlpD
VSTESLPTWRAAAALTALALFAVACGQTVSPQERSSGPAAMAEPRLSSDADDAEASPGPMEGEWIGEPDGSASADERMEPVATEPEATDEPVGEPEPVAGGEADAASAPADSEPASTRVVADSGWAPFASVEGVTLVHPALRVERIGFHQANHDGARQLEVLPGAVEPMTLDSRGRATGSHSAADIVVDPDGEIRAPATGTVLRAGTYVLYCDYSDDFVVIEPDARPGWEVKLLHIDGVQVSEGQRVEAGRTVLAPRPTPLPFESQVDEYTAEPSWPHVHLEVVDPSIPNESSGGGC